jgi:flagellar protein FliS
LSANLDSLYDYIIRRLTQANYENNHDYLEECGRLLGDIKVAWDSIGSQVSQE